MAHPNDHGMEVRVAGMLRIGVIAASLLVMTGGALLLRHPWAAAPSYAHFRASGAGLSTVAGIVEGVQQMRGTCIVQFGLLVLIATPVARVAYCVVGFARQRDRLYVAVSVVVLAILAYSLLQSSR